MTLKINDIINKYKDTEIYEILKKYYINNPVNEEQYNFLLNQIKDILLKYYLNKYKFKSYISNEKQDELLCTLKSYYSLSKKVRNNNGKIKIYPIRLSNEEHEEIYINIMKQMIDYEINNETNIENIFYIFNKKIKNILKNNKEKLIQMDMEPYYGSPNYMIGRTRFIKECIKQIPNLDLNIDDIINKMEEFEKKYIINNTEKHSEEFCDIDENFYKDYEEIEKCYKIILDIENKLAPIVSAYWKNYLTNPNNHDYSNYKYVMHTFSKGMVDPSLMNKACCSLNTDELVITPYGDCGLIYSFDEDSLETLCTDDAGSWSCSKNDFFERECPGKWQLPNPNETCIWYESYQNSKIIMPNVFEKICKENNISYNGEMLNNTKSLCYSEIYLNKNAYPVGVFYTDLCMNYDLVEAYAKKYNLPLINISLAKQREIKGLESLNGMQI